MVRGGLMEIKSKSPRLAMVWRIFCLVFIQEQESQEKNVQHTQMNQKGEGERERETNGGRGLGRTSRGKVSESAVAVNDLLFVGNGNELFLVTVFCV